MTLANVTNVYDNLDRGRVVVSRVHDESFQRFSSGVSTLASTVPVEDQRMRIVVAWLKRLRFILSAAPVRFNHPFDHCLETPPLADWRAELWLSYGAKRDVVNDVFGLVEEFALATDAPLRSTFEELLVQCERGKRVAVVSPDTSLLSCFDNEAIAAGQILELNVAVMGQRGLKDDDSYDDLYLFGAPTWFRWHVFAAPRAPTIHVIQYAWIPLSLPTGPNVEESSVDSHTPRRHLETRGDAMHGRQLSTEDIRTDWLEADDEPDRDAHQTGLAEDAKLVMLEAGYGVYLPTAEDARVIIIDESSGVPEISHISVVDLEPGMHVVLRTEGAADYVREVADSLLGSKARVLRSIQLEWKQRLVARVHASDEDQVAAELRTSGLSYASGEAVRRWCSARNIATKTEEAFIVLVRFIGLGDRTAELWANSQELWAAHRSAGLRIRTMLLSVVRDSDLTPLRRYGRVDFELDASGAGTLTAFTVRALSEKVRPVQAARISKPFQMAAAYSWLD